MKKLLMCSCAEKWGDIAPLVLRVATGLVFFMHGWQKLQGGVPGTAAFLQSLQYPLPELMAVLLIAAEVLGGAALILGVFTHWAAKISAFVALVAWLTVHLQGGFFASNGGYEFIMVLFAACVSLMITGAGKYSLDYKWFQK
jgi:putative oxidoreductase